VKRFPSSQFQSHPRSLKAAAVLVSIAAVSLLLFNAAPVQARDLTPEFTSRVWLENDSEVAAVSLNGKDLITFRAKAGTDEAAEEAEDLAIRLQEVVTERGFDPSLLLPARDGEKAALRLAGNTVASFDPLAGKKDGDAVKACLDASIKLANGLRTALGASVLPACFPDLSDKAALASKDLKGQLISGQASWYGAKFHGRRTSDGSRFDMNKLTAAHRSLPFGTKLLVMNRKTGNSCVVEVNDRGPFIGNRIIDLSRGAASQLNMLGSGVAMVDCLVLGNRD
jgi:rare lipoprotein A